MIVILYTLINFSYQEIQTTSNIQLCNSTQNQNCSDLLFLQLKIENSYNASTEQIEINQTIINNLTFQLTTPINISITKTPIFAYYPIKYFKEYNSKPFEIQIPSTVNPCDDNWNSNSPTCEFQYQNQNKIQDSQGFCCSCKQSEQNNNQIRNDICNQAKVQSMAFCLRYSPLWYSSYNISKFAIYYNITLSIHYSNDETEQFTLGSESKSWKGQSSFAKVIQDFLPQNQPPSLESFNLVKPNQPIDHNRVQIGSAAYMLIPKQLIGLGECNKIGVSYTSFKNQTDKCAKEISSCLLNQLEDLYQNDLALINNNSRPQYLIEKYGQFKQININNDQFLQFSINEYMTTIIELQINTTNRISYFGNNKGNEKGQINQAEIYNFSFTLGSGLFYAQITNVGDIIMKFKSFLNCSINQIEINSQDISLEPLKSKIIQQEIDLINEINQSNQCNFSILNNEGSLLDWKIVQLIEQYDQTSENQDNKQNQQNSIKNNCKSQCSQIFDINCYFENNCDSQTITFFAVLSGISFILIFCCLYVEYKKKIGGCWSQRQNQSILQQEDSQINRRMKLSNSSQTSISLEQVSILPIQKNKMMYLNLALGTDPISNEIQSDASFEVLATYKNQELIKLQIKKKSPFINIFRQIYGFQDVERNVRKYLEGKVDSIKLFSSLLTEFPLFSIF